jgi:hypothetical protein
MRKRTVFSLLVALMALVALTGTCTPLAAHAQASIHLHDMVQAPSRQVRLSNIATVHGPGSQVLGRVLVATLSRPGQPVRIDVARVVQMIVRQQPALAGRFAMTGAANVSVVLASGPAAGVARNQRDRAVADRRNPGGKTDGGAFGRPAGPVGAGDRPAICVHPSGNRGRAAARGAQIA